MQTTLKIGGMSCGHCVKHVKEALEGVKGVKKAHVELESASAVVEHKDSVAVEALASAVADAGYEVVG